MAKVTLTLTDNDDGTVLLLASFDPPMEDMNLGDLFTPAQAAAFAAIEAISNQSE